MRKFQKRCAQFLFVVSFMLLGAFSITACGTTDSTAATTTSQKTTVTTPTSGQAQVNCGSISQSMRGPVTSKDDPQKVVDCFWSAFQQCRPASLDFKTSGVDTVLTRTFQLQKAGSSCQVLEKVQNQIFPQKPRVTGTYVCASVQKNATALQFMNCQTEGTVKVPLSK